MKGNFIKDFIAWLPFAPFVLFSDNYSFLRIAFIIKLVRFKQLIDYMSPKKILPILREYYE